MNSIRTAREGLLEISFRLIPQGWKLDFCRRRCLAELPIDVITNQCHLLNFDMSLKEGKVFNSDLYWWPLWPTTGLLEPIYLMSAYTAYTRWSLSFGRVEHRTRDPLVRSSVLWTIMLPRTHCTFFCLWNMVYIIYYPRKLQWPKYFLIYKITNLSVCLFVCKCIQIQNVKAKNVKCFVYVH